MTLDSFCSDLKILAFGHFCFARKQRHAAGAVEQRIGQRLRGEAEDFVGGRASPLSAHEHASAPDATARQRRIECVLFDQLLRAQCPAKTCNHEPGIARFVHSSATMPEP